MLLVEQKLPFARRVARSFCILDRGARRRHRRDRRADRRPRPEAPDRLTRRNQHMANITIDAEPEPIAIDPQTHGDRHDRHAARLPGAGRLRRDAGQRRLAAGGGDRAVRRRCSRGARRQGMLVIHTREGHRPDLADAPPAKVERGAPSKRIGDAGPDGAHPDPRRARPRHHRRRWRRCAGEPVIDKPGKGAFFATDLHAILQQPRHREPDRLRRDHRGLRPHDGARGQRPRLPLHRRRRLLRLVLSRSFTRWGCG